LVCGSATTGRQTSCGPPLGGQLDWQARLDRDLTVDGLNLAGSGDRGCHAANLDNQRARLVMVVAMTEQDAYCDFCDLPLAQCVHGQPPPAEVVVVKSSTKPRKSATAKSRAPDPVTRPVNRRWTPPEALKPHILAVLREADGGELEADEVFLELEILLEDRMLSGDRENTPTGEPRWQYAARRARVALINEGLMTKGIPGVWKLTKAP
jgi:hypothetical protein